MKRFALVLITLLFLLSACSQSHETKIRALPLSELFLAMNPDATYSETVFDNDNGVVAELAKSECPSAGDSFVRASIESTASQLVIYANNDVSQVQCSILKPKKEQKIDLKSAEEAPDDQTAIVVNGQTISMTLVQQAVQTLPQTARNVSTLNDVVNRLINDELLRQASLSIDVSEEQLRQQQELLLTTANLTEAQLPDVLAEQNITKQQWDDSVKSQAKIQELLRQRLLLDNINVTEQDVKEYYLSNPNAFLRSEQAIARFLVIGSNGRTLEQGNERLQEISDKLATTDFCALVKEYSDDATAKDQCGVYTIPRGVLPANLESAAFTTPQNQTAVVTTNDGIYLVQTLQVTPAQVVPYSQIAPFVQSSLRNALFEQRLNLYLAQLRSEATIISYLG